MTPIIGETDGSVKRTQRTFKVLPEGVPSRRAKLIERVGKPKALLADIAYTARRGAGWEGRFMACHGLEMAVSGSLYPFTKCLYPIDFK